MLPFFMPVTCERSLGDIGSSASSNVTRMLPRSSERRTTEASPVRVQIPLTNFSAVPFSSTSRRKSRVLGDSVIAFDQPFHVGWRGWTSSLKASKPFHAGSIRSQPGMGVKGDGSLSCIVGM